MRVSYICNVTVLTCSTDELQASHRYLKNQFYLSVCSMFWQNTFVSIQPVAAGQVRDSGLDDGSHDEHDGLPALQMYYRHPTAISRNQFYVLCMFWRNILVSFLLLPYHSLSIGLYSRLVSFLLPYHSLCPSVQPCLVQCALQHRHWDLRLWPGQQPHWAVLTWFCYLSFLGHKRVRASIKISWRPRPGPAKKAAKQQMEAILSTSKAN